MATNETLDLVDKIESQLRRLNAGGTPDGDGINAAADNDLPSGWVRLADAGGSIIVGSGGNASRRGRT